MSESTAARKPRQKFSELEDKLIREQIEIVGEGNWTLVAKAVPGRTARQCRERWVNYLSPNVDNSPWTSEEDKKLEKLVDSLGKKWSLIAKHFPKRTDVLIKNRYTLLYRRKSRDNNEGKITLPPFLENTAAMDRTQQASKLQTPAEVKHPRLPLIPLVIPPEQMHYNPPLRQLPPLAPTLARLDLPITVSEALNLRPIMLFDN